MAGLNRRNFTKLALAAAAAGGARQALAAPASKGAGDAPRVPVPARVTSKDVAGPAEAFPIGATTWSFHLPLFKGELKASDMPALLKGLGVSRIEWTSKTFRDLKGGMDVMFKAPPAAFFQDVRRAADDAGMQSHVVNVGGPVFLAGKDKATRDKAVDFALSYVEGARLLGARILRIELYCDLPQGPHRREEALAVAREGMHALLERTEGSGLIINTENHHGISAEPAWMARFMRSMNHPRLGLTVDTNNIRVDDDNPYAPIDPHVLPRSIDRYDAVAQLMPYANWVSAKTYTFDNAGYEIALDYPRLMKIIMQSGYRGCLSVEYEGNLAPADGVRRSVAMFERLKEHLAAFV